MQIYNGSAASGGEFFLHAGYLSARESLHIDSSPSTPTLGSNDYQSPRMPLVDAAVLLLFFAGVLLLKYSRGVPLWRRRLAMVLLVGVSMLALILPACTAAMERDPQIHISHATAALDRD